MLTEFSQVTREINANDLQLAKMIRGQMDVRDERATRIINAYEGAQHGSPEAEGALLELYNGWRADNAATVAPIAEGLGFPAPGSNGAASPFAVTPAPAPSDAPAWANPAPTSDPTPKTAPGAAEGAKRTRRAWAQGDIANMTRTLVLAAKADHEAVLTTLAVELDRDVGEVRTKAVELALIEAPPVAAKYELSEGDKKMFRKRVFALVNDEQPLDMKIAQFKHCAVELREIIKELAG